MLRPSSAGQESTVERNTPEIGTAWTSDIPIEASGPEARTADDVLKTPESPEIRTVDDNYVHNYTLPELSSTPLRDLDPHAWLDSSSPLSVAVRRRQFLRPELGRGIIAEDHTSREYFPPEPSIRSSATSLYSLDSLEVVGGPHSDLQYRDRSSAREGESDVVKRLILPSTPESKARNRLSDTQARGGETPPRTPLSAKDSTSDKGSAAFIFPHVSEDDPRRSLSNTNLAFQRSVFGFIVLAINIGCLVGALKSHRHLWVLIVILIAKAKDVLSTLIQIAWLFVEVLKRQDRKSDQRRKWILTCVTAYAETQEQIMRTINSVIDSTPPQHKTAMVIILDGKPQTILQHFSEVIQTIRRPYQSWRYRHNEANIYTGLIRNVPVILIEKIGNAGKKDSLILCHDLFNHIRDNAPEPTKGLRLEFWTVLLPKIIRTDFPEKFDFLFFTDADSLIHTGTLDHLVNALMDEPHSIAACGLVLAEMTTSNTWSMWYLYQQFQYTYGQFVRRRAEGIWGRVTCLPGCVTMIKNRPEMAGAIELYASPVPDRMVLKHQVQYLGTDRRITWCMLEQSKHLKTLFVPKATSQTVAPQSFVHYMSQRRRWGSNAYFNDICYILGMNSRLITRLWGVIDLVRQTLVYYRLANTILFIYGLSRHFVFIKLVPYIVVTQTPTVWFVIVVLVREPILRRMAHKLLAGWIINKLISPFFSILIFSRIILNLGNAVWGQTGASTRAANVLDILHTLTPKRSWTPNKLKTLVRNTIKERTRSKKVGSKLTTPMDSSTPNPASQVIAEKQGTTSYYSPTMPTTPQVVRIPVNEVETQGTVRRHKSVKLESEIGEI